MEHLMFVVFVYETGDREVPQIILPTVIDGGDKPVDIDYLTDGISSFYDSDYQADTDEDALSVILDCSGYAWHFIADGESVPHCNDGFRMIYV